MRVVSPPFRQLGVDRLLSDDWQMSIGSVSQLLPPFIPHWDANVNLRLARSVIVDIDSVRRDCGIGNTRLRLVAAWRSSGTAIRGVGTHIDLSDEGIQVAVLQIEIPGASLALDVELTTQLILGSTSDAPSPAPRIAGSILWQDSITVLLESQASRFPIEVADFDTVVWAPAGAAWLLVWNTEDLRQPLLRGLRLFLNARHRAVVDAVQMTLPAAEHQAVRSAIYYDVGTALIRGALGNEEFAAEPAAYPEGSVGRAIYRLISSLFPNQTAASLRSTQLQRPDYFDSMLQAAFRLFVL